MSRRLRLAASVVAAAVFAAVFLQVFPDLSGRLQVVAQQAYYFRQFVPNIGGDGS
jgi:hypothetical protein